MINRGHKKDEVDFNDNNGFNQRPSSSQKPGYKNSNNYNT